MAPKKQQHEDAIETTGEETPAAMPVEPETVPTHTLVVYDGPLPHVAIHVGRTSTVSLCRGIPARIETAIAEDLITRKKVRAATREEIAAAE